MWLAGAFFFFMMAVLGHAWLCRVQLSMNVVFRFLIFGCILGAGLIWWLYNEYGITHPQLWAGILIYGFVCELYIFLFTLVISSVSVNLLVSLLGGKMTRAEIDSLYDSGQMVSTRLDRLTDAGFLTRGLKGFELTQKGARTIRMFEWLRSFFHHRSSAYNLKIND
jgi:hypothetical protein